MKSLQEVTSDSCVECVAVVQATGDEGLSDGSPGADGEPFEDLPKHAKSEEAGGGYCVDLGFHGELAVQYDAEVPGIVDGSGRGSDSQRPPGVVP